jgi:hypothetical protein
MEEVSALYHALLEAWNRHDAAGYAALFADDGYVVGFDGSEMKGRHEIEQSLGAIFAGDVAMLGAVAGLVPAGKPDLNPQLSAIQTLIAKRGCSGWRILQFQNTPAQFHGRPEDAEALTHELRALV